MNRSTGQSPISHQSILAQETSPTKTSKYSRLRNLLKHSLLTLTLVSIIGGLSGCNDGKITEEAAKQAGKILKAWQDQNR